MLINDDIAKQLGMNTAAVYSVIESEIKSNGAPLKGHRYARIPVRLIHDRLPFITSKTIIRAVQRLEDEGYIESIDFLGRSKWRRIVK